MIYFIVTINGFQLYGYGTGISSVSFGSYEVDIINSTLSTVTVRIVSNNVTNDTSVDITITSDTRAIIQSPLNYWTYLPNGVISSVTPSIGQEGSIVTITGSNLLGGGNDIALLYIDGIRSNNIMSYNSTTIIVQLGPLMNSDSNYPLGSVYIQSDNGAIVTGGSFQHLSPGSINAFTPTVGRQGTLISIQGFSLTGYGSAILNVTVGGYPVLSDLYSTVNNDTILIIRVGPAPTGTSGPIVLTIDTGVTIQSNDTFTYTQQGTIDSVSPSVGAEGTGVLIQGTYLTIGSLDIANVTIGDRPVMRIVTSSANQISVIAGPASDTLTALPVTITLQDGSYVQGGTFTYQNISASIIGSNSGQYGTRITISAPFNVSAVYIGDQLATVLSVTDNNITVSVPRATRHGQYMTDVTVHSTHHIIARIVNGFTYLPEGIILSVTPSIGQKGTALTIEGERLLGGGNGISSVEFNGVPTNVLNYTDTVINLTVSANLPVSFTYPYTTDITVTSDTGSIVNRLGGFTFTQPGTITSLTPSMGQYGTIVHVYGTNLLQDELTILHVTVVGIEATVIGIPNDTHIQLQLNPGPTATGPLSITLNTGAVISSPSNIVFSYISAGVITSVQPPVGSVGTIVTISGTNLLGGGTAISTITISGYMTTVLTGTNTQCTVRVINATDSGGIVIIADTGAIVSSANDLWTYVPLGYINSVTPLTGQQGVMVDISGANLTANSTLTTVTMAGITATIVSQNNTHVQVIAGYSNTSLVGPIVLEQESGPVIISTVEWSYYQSALLSAIPSSGTNGTHITLYGTNIGQQPNTSYTVSSVTIGTVMAYDIVIISSDAIRIRAGFYPTLSAPLTITVYSSSGAYVSLPLYWSYITPGVISSLNPSLPTAPGTNVTIHGTGLVPINATSITVVTGNTVSFSAHIVNSSAIVFRVGMYVTYTNTSLHVTVIANDGSSLTTPTPLFTFQEVITMVTSLTPSVGSNGSMVRIEGNDLINTTIRGVYLGGVMATINSLSSTLITVTAGPTGTVVRGQLIIETIDGLLYGGNEWIYLPSLNSTYLSPNEGRNGTIVNIDITSIPDTYTVQYVTIGGSTGTITSLTNDTVTVRAINTSSDDNTVVIHFQDNIELIIPDSWTALAPITITNISTLVGYYGTIVYINGSQFNGVQSVTVAGMNTLITTRTDSLLVLSITSRESNSSASGPVVMIGYDGSVHTSQYTFTYLQVTIDYLSPTYGQYGTIISIYGNTLLAGGNTLTAMTIGNITVHSILSVSNSVINVTAGPSDQPMGPLDITYTVDTGAVVTIATSWSYISPGVINTVSPSTGRRGTVVVVTGRGLLVGGQYISSVLLSGVPSGEVMVSNDEFIQVRAGHSSNTVAGTITVIANTGAMVTSNVTFQYLSPYNISSITPSYGQYGTVITISSDTALYTAAIDSVSVNGVRASIVTVTNESMVTVRAGNPSFIGSSEGSIIITSTDGSIAESDTNFTYVIPGAIYSVSPNTGVQYSVVTINGQGLRGGGNEVVSVLLADVPATILSQNDTTVRLTVNEGYPSNGDVLLVSDTGAIVIRVNGWTYIEQGIIETVFPTSGQYGTYITLTGYRLTGGGQSVTHVTIGNITSLEVMFSNDTVVTFRAGNPIITESFNGTIGLISNDNGTVTSNQSWIYNEESTVTDINPTNGTGASIVNITGERLLGGGNSIVSVSMAGITVRDILTANDTLIQVEIGFTTDGQPLTGDIIIEADTGALTVVYGGWTYLSECPIGQHGNHSDNCTPCHPECNHCYGPSQFNCYSCLNFEIVATNECVPSCPSLSTVNKQCVDQCLPNQYPSISTNDSQRYCMNCSTLCDPTNSCTGPYPYQCGSCAVLMDTGGVCVSECPIGSYISNRTCLPCSQQCLLTNNCTGPAPTQCNTCANVSISSTDTSLDECIPMCPSDYYMDRFNHCRPCHSLCVGGCTGPSSTDCMQCTNTSIVHDNGTIECVTSCNNGNINNMYRDVLTGQCMPCHSYCSLQAGCTGPTASDCILCSNYTLGGTTEFIPRYEEECVLTCPNDSYYIDTRNGYCELCHSSCSIGCTGPSISECIIEPVDNTPTVSQLPTNTSVGAFTAGIGTIVLVIIIVIIILTVCTLITIILMVRLRRGKQYSPTESHEMSISPTAYTPKQEESNFTRPPPPHIAPYIPKKRSASAINVEVSRINPAYLDFTSGGIELHEEDETPNIRNELQRSPSPEINESTGLLSESYPPPARPPRQRAPTTTVPPITAKTAAANASASGNEYVMDETEEDDGEMYIEMDTPAANDVLCLSTQDEYNERIDVTSPLPVLDMPPQQQQSLEDQGLYEETDSTASRIHPLIQAHTTRPPAVPPRLRTSTSSDEPPPRPPRLNTNPTTTNTATNIGTTAGGQDDDDDDFAEECYEQMLPTAIIPRQNKH